MLHPNALQTLKRPIRLALIGGGPGSFIGRVHQTAARLDNRYQIVNAALSSNPDKARSAALAMGIDAARIAEDPEAMIRAEADHTEGADAVAIMTPNDSHHRLASAALHAGLHVICDKPMTNTLAEARELTELVRQKSLVFCLTHNYTGYPLVRQARAMVRDGAIGELLLVQVEYVQGGRAPGNDPAPGGSVPWRYDPERGGPSLVMGDIGTHAHNLVRFVTGKEIESVCADAGSVVPGRNFHDFTGALLRLNGGARGSFWVTQAAAGVENALRFRISGSEGSLEWEQEIPQRLIYRPFGRPAEIRTPNGPGTVAEAARALRIVAGHPEGFIEGFANIYADAAEAIAAAITGAAADPLALDFPTADDGLKGVEFIDAVLRSSASGGWVEIPNNAV